MMKNRGISSSLLAVTLIIIVVGAGAAYYFVSTQPGKGTSSTSSAGGTSTTSTSTPLPSTSTSHGVTSAATSPHATTTPSTTSTSIATSSTVIPTTGYTTTSVSSSTLISTCTPSGTTTTTYQGPLFQTSMFDDFSAMSLDVSGVSSGQTMSADYSYVVVGKPMINGTQFYEVNVTAAAGSMGATIVLWITQDGHVSMAEQMGVEYTGQQAESMASSSGLATFVAIYGADAYFTYLTVGGSFHMVNQTSVALGPSTAMVTYYTADHFPYVYSYCGVTTTVDDMLIGMGTVVGTSVTLMTYAHVSQTMGSYETDATFRLTSVTKA